MENLALSLVVDQVAEIATLILDYASHIIKGLGQVAVNLLSMLTASTIEHASKVDAQEHGIFHF